MKTINIRFPLEDDKEKNRLFSMNTITNDALTSNLVLLLLTDKGERLYLPNYGTDLRKHIFEPKDNITESDIEENLKETVKEFIPQLTITSVRFFRDIDDVGDTVDDNEVRVTINFIYTDDVFSDVNSLELAING